MPHPLSPRLFHDELVRHDRAELARRLSAAPEQAALRAIAAAEQGGRLTEDDYIALLSPAAAPHLERMAGAARAITLRNFGSCSRRCTSPTTAPTAACTAASTPATPFPGAG